MHILFIHTYNYYEPLGIMYLSAVLKKNGHHCSLLDLKFEKKYISEVKKLKPDIIAYSVTTNNWGKYQEINKKLKEHFTFLSVFGGPHATFYPELINEEGIDVICRGEGEEPMLELADALEKKELITQIKNLWVKQEGALFKNDVRPLIEDIDALPFPDREIINKYKHYLYRSRVRTITSRGCPYRCTYCYNHVLQEIYKGKGRYVRLRSPQNVIEEVKYLKALYNPRNIEFHDDVFILDTEWLRKFSELYISNEINLAFEINIKAELITPEIVSILKKTGCYSVQYGIESGNEKIRKELLRRHVTDAQIIETAHLLNKSGIKTNTYNMIGYPNESFENALETLYLNIKCKPVYAMNTIYFPYPMNELTQYSTDMGLFDNNYHNNRKNLFYGNIVIDTPLKKKFKRLHYLFAYGVKFPFLLPFIKFLTRLPFSYLYHLLYFLYRAYVIIFVFKRLTIREIFITEK